MASEQQPDRNYIHIVSDGTRLGTHVYEGDTDISRRIKAIDWHIDVETGIATSTITWAMASVDVTALVDEYRMFDVARNPSWEEDDDDGSET